MATDKPPINEDDDLFNFDEMNNASWRPASETSSVAPQASSPAPVAPVALVAPVAPRTPAQNRSIEEPVIASAEPATATAPRTMPTQLPLVKPVMFQEVEAQLSRAQQAPRPAQPGRRRPGALTLAVLASAMLFNIALVGVVWRSMSTTSPAPVKVAEPVAQAETESAPEPTQRPKAFVDLKIEAPTSSEGELALETAAREIRQGEYERARSRVYSLLSVIDRFDPATRPDLAARAQVLAADAYREQALTVEKHAALSIEKAGFIDEPTQERP